MLDDQFAKDFMKQKKQAYQQVFARGDPLAAGYLRDQAAQGL